MTPASTRFDGDLVGHPRLGIGIDMAHQRDHSVLGCHTCGGLIDAFFPFEFVEHGLLELRVCRHRCLH